MPRTSTTTVIGKIGPYRLESRLGAGGMGEVFRAYDERLERQVAIKLVRAEVREDANAAERFRREARAVASLSHPAVVQIHDILRWQGRDCIVMELVEGQTLRALLRAGPLDLEPVLALAREIAGGLVEAHDKGIVHRDLKAKNVMVTPAGHAKILDFGLAKRLTRDQTVSVPGQLIGTLTAMSPEQAQGQRADYRSDLFSFGVLLYEMLTGETPFRGDSPRETLVKICMHRQPSPRQVHSEVPRALSELVDHLLKKDPERRPQSAVEVVAALARMAGATPDRGSSPAAVASEDATLPAGVASGGFVPGSLGGPSSPPVAGGSDSGAAAGGESSADVSSSVPASRSEGVSSDTRRRWRFLAAIGLAAGAVLGYVSLQRDRPPTPVTQVTARRSLAVLGFENLSGRGDADWISTALAEQLTAALAAGGELRTLGGQEVARLLRDLGLGDPASLSRDDLEHLKQFGIDILVTGSFDFADEDGRLQVDLRWQDTATGAVAESGSSTRQLSGLAEGAANRLRKELGVAKLSPADALAVRESLPADPEAVRLYALGLTELRQLDALSARDLLRLAVEVEPHHPLPHAALAEVWLKLGYHKKAEEAAAKANELSGRLSARDRLAIEARYYEVSKDWDEAITIHRQLFTPYPDDLHLGLRLADAQIAGEKYREAWVTLETLRQLPAPAAEDPRIDLTEALAQYRLGELEVSMNLAMKAARKGQELGANLLVARARIREATALQNMGNHAAAVAAVDKARAFYQAAGDRTGLAKALELKAAAVRDLGNPEGARRLFESSLEIYRSIGDKRREASVLYEIGTIFMVQGNLIAAEDYFSKAVSIFRELDARLEATVVLNAIGYLLQVQGRLAEALGEYRDVLDFFTETGNKDNLAIVLTNIGEVQYLLGDLEQAEKMHEEALAISQAIGNKSGEAYDTFRLGKVSAARGDLFVARKRYQSALKLQNERGEEAAAAETRMGLALLELVEGRTEESLRLASEAEEVFRTSTMADFAALSQVVRGRALLAQKRAAEARQAHEAAWNVAASSEDRRLLFATAILGARLCAISGLEADVAAALSELETAARQAGEAGFVEYELEARLAAGEVEMRSGRTAAGKARLEDLEKEARDRGFGQIAERAKILLKG